MPFNLEVEFSGLCLYLVQEDGKAVGIVMPDGRQNRPQSNGQTGRPTMPDDFGKSKEYLVNHVGYLRYDLTDLVPRIGASIPSQGGTPSSEVVYRFDRDDLAFEFQTSEPMQVGQIDMPDLAQFAPTASTKPGLFGPKPPTELLMRTILTGGSLTTQPNGGLSEFNLALNPDGATYVGQFAGSATWKCAVSGNDVVLRVRDWKGRDKNVVHLSPREDNGIVRVKIANLCAENPLEWPELFLRMSDGEPDNDFKWFYSLWADSRGSFGSNLSAPRLLPVPKPIQAHGDVTNCTGSLRFVASVGGA